MFNLKKVAAESFGVLQKVMPWVGAVAASVATSNPMPLLSQVAQQVSEATGQPVQPTPSAINAAVQNATPDQMATLKQIDNDFAAKMKAMGFQNEQQLAQITASDRDSARKMQGATGSYLPGFLAVLAVASVMVCVYWIALYPTQQQGHDALLMLLGALIAAFKDVYGFFFGSSAGEQAASKALQNGQ